MILDELNEFADNLSVINNAGATYILGDTIDLGATPTLRDLGPSQTLYVVARVSDAILASAGAATVQFKLVSDSTADLATSPTTHLDSGAIAKATLVAGYTIFASQLPFGAYERYLGITYTVATNNLTAGKVDAFLTADAAAWRAYARGDV